jgi:NitT/TauT family transport system permease protein
MYPSWKLSSRRSTRLREARADVPVVRSGRRAIERTAVALVLALAWEMTARAAHSLLFPTLLDTLRALVRLIPTTAFWRSIWISNEALLSGFPVAGLGGVLLGLWLGRSKTAGRWLDVHVHLLLVLPKSALMPLLAMALGFGLTMRASVVALFALPVVVMTAKAGIEAVDPRFIEMARAFGATEGQVWRHVLLPAARPAVAMALRLGLARAIDGMVAVELILAAVGAGRLLLRFRADFDAASTYAVVLVVAAEAVALMALTRRAGGRLPSVAAERWLA